SATRLATELSAVLGSITDTFFTVDAGLRCVYANREAGRLAETTVEHLRGKPVSAAFPPVLALSLERAIREALHSGDPAEIDSVHDKTGVSLVGRAYPSAFGCAIYLRDETEAQRARDALRQSEE